MAGYKRTRTIVESDSGEKSTIIGQEGMKVPSDKTKLTVGEVAKLTGVKDTTLRYYDKIGLLCPSRTGEGVSNNRKLYGVDDLDRLQTIQTLSGYSFSLNEIRQILDDENIDIYDVFAHKLLELRRHANRLRNLILFMKFIDVTDANRADLLEGLACGPVSVDLLANLARDSFRYKNAIEQLEQRSDEECTAALDTLTTIMTSLFAADESSGFTGVEQTITEFASWWNAFVIPMEDIGYLGFWALFEDHGLIPESIEAMGAAGDAGFVQMYVFFAWMVRLIKNLGSSIADVAQLANKDIVAALEDGYELIDELACEMVGREVADAADIEDLADLAFCVAHWMASILADKELRAYLNLAANLAFELDDIEMVARLFDVLGNTD